MPPLVLLGAAWLLGIVLAWRAPSPTEVPLPALGLLALVPAGALLLGWKDRSTRLGAACGLMLLLGTVRTLIAQPDLTDPSHVASYHQAGPEWVALEGVVRGYPDVREAHTNLHVAAEWIEVEDQRLVVRGTVQVQAPRYPEIRYGDRVHVAGLLETPPDLESFSYRDYLAKQGIYSLLRRAQVQVLAHKAASPFLAALYTVRDRGAGVVARLMPEPEASLLQGILLGIETGIPQPLYDDFHTTGTSHIIVISGANVVLLSGLLSRSAGRLMGKRRAYWVTTAGIGAYALLVGGDAAVLRAGLMGWLYVTAAYLGRLSTAYVSLVAAAIGLTAWNPMLLADAGFQLSVAATAGLIFFSEPLARAFEGLLGRILQAERAKEAVRYLNDALVVTLAAQITTTPLVMHLFGRLSLVSPLANLLILPLQPYVMTCGGAALLIGLIPALAPVAQVLAWVPWLCLAYTVRVVEGLAAWPLASLDLGPVSGAWLVLYYGALAGLVALRRQPRAAARRVGEWLADHWSAALMLGVPLVAAVLIWLAVFQLPDGRLHLAFLDVGQGDAILITTPEGAQILVDGGPGPAALTSALGREMPFWDRSLEAVILTHADGDHVGGLPELLSRYAVGTFLDSGRPDDHPTYQECVRSLAAHGVAHQPVQAGAHITLDDVALDVLSPPAGYLSGTSADDNNNSLVIRLTYGEMVFLLTGDAEAEAEGWLLHSGAPLDAHVLKAGHHGSGGASTPAFLSAVGPRYVVLSVGAGNRFGHPDPQVLERLDQLGDVTVLRTDEQGTLEFVTDGQQLWVRTGR
jgi:competence protein ComEC